MISVQRVLKPVKQNHGNHEKRKSEEGLDYDTECAKTYLDRWRYVLKYPIVFQHKFNDDEREVLIDAIKIGAQTGLVSSLHREELKEIADRMSLGDCCKDGWFCRFNGASPKDGRFDWPMMSAEDVIGQVSTSWRASQCLRRNDQTLYFCKFDANWDEKRELRAFVHRGHLTAITQYCLSFKEPWSTMDNETLTAVATNIKCKLEKYYKDLSEACCESFVIDCYVENNLDIRFIELNAFGYWLPAGPGLFHWIDDYDILYGENGDKTVFRVLS